MRLLLPPALGAIATLGFAPFDFWPASIAALAGLLWLIDAQTTRRAALSGWLFGFAHFATGVYWVYISTHVYGGAAAWLAVLLGAVLFSYLALYPALFCALAGGALKQRTGWLALPLLWVFLELVRGWFYSGFPWLSLGYISLDTPVSKLAPMAGVHSASAIAVLMAYALYRLITVRGRARLIPVAILFAPALTGLLPQPASWTSPDGAPLRLALVQSNIAQDQKWLPHMRQEALARHWRMTESAWPADLVIWPEVALTQPHDVLRDGYLAELHSRARAQKATVLLGILLRDGEQFYNGAVTVGESESRYYKRHLVPFGEYFPVPDFIRPLMDVLNLPYSDFSFGAGVQEFPRVRGHGLALGICFEDVFGNEVRRDAHGTGFLVNITNDAWFAGSSAPHQHLQFSRMRAIETGRPLARTANTGISAFIDANGEVVKSLPQAQQDVLRGEVQPRRGETPYMRWGDLPLWLLGVAGLAAALWARRKT